MCALSTARERDSEPQSKSCYTALIEFVVHSVTEFPADTNVCYFKTEVWIQMIGTRRLNRQPNVCLSLNDIMEVRNEFIYNYFIKLLTIDVSRKGFVFQKVYLFGS